MEPKDREGFQNQAPVIISFLHQYLCFIPQGLANLVINTTQTMPYKQLLRSLIFTIFFVPRKFSIYGTGGLTNVDFSAGNRNGIDHAFLTTFELLSMFLFCKSHPSLTEMA